MHKTTRNDAAVLRAYFIAEAVIFAAIKLAELSLPMPTVRLIRYSAILLNTAMTVWIYTAYGRTSPMRRENLLALGLGITCGADFFLTLLGGGAMFGPGVGLFCAVETVYAVYLRPSRANLIARGILFVLLSMAAWALGVFTVPILLGVLNLSLLALNVVCAWKACLADRDNTSLLCAVGFSLFLICDTNVALEVMVPEGSLVHTIAMLTVWTVYVPAQVLLVLTYYRLVRSQMDALSR